MATRKHALNQKEIRLNHEISIYLNKSKRPKFQGANMKTIFLNLTFAVAITFILSCSDKITAGCSCMSTALEVNAIGKENSSISLDSIQYIYDNGEIETIHVSATEHFDGFVGSKAGEYKVWAFYNGLKSEMVTVDVEMAGPDDCRLPSTKKITFQFEDEYKGNQIGSLAGCDE